MGGHSVRMKRLTLTGLPECLPPPDFSIRWFQPGDEATWVDVQTAAERFLRIDRALFAREFHGDGAGLGQRQAFLVSAAGRAVGTATAWYDDLAQRPAWGRVHWVALRPEVQGRGLAKPLLAAVLGRLRDLGHQHAYLHTSTQRVPAITLYLEFGFRPEPRNPDERQAWQALAPALRPAARAAMLASLTTTEGTA